MLFNSSTFLLYFLPLVVVGFILLTRAGLGRASVLWLACASSAFYGWWHISYLPLLFASMTANFLLGRRLARRPSSAMLTLGVTANILLLGYYKYTGFIVKAADQLAGFDWAVPQIALPLAISFFTFQQIAYLSDANDGAAVEHDFLNYWLFIFFFPHIIAGPITHHREMLPQFGRLMSGKGEVGRGSVGITLFLIGLFKKVAIADPCGTYARPVFALASDGHVPQLAVAWTGALSYALQIYFDFSGYTDMAIGLGLLFGISLPPNFDSPFKARNIIEYWSRWHMTLTRFLTAYIYNPIVLRLTRARMQAGLHAPQRGKMTPGAFAMLVAIPSVLTMFVSGVWHGAGWQFMIFGLLHGFYLVINHGWRTIKAARGWAADGGGMLSHVASVLLTFICVLVGLVFFRADNVGAAMNLLHGMIGGQLMVDTSVLHWPLIGALIAHVGLPIGETTLVTFREVLWIGAMLFVVWFLPNATQWMRRYQTALNTQPKSSWIERVIPAITWRPSPAFGFLVGIVGTLTLMRALSAAPTEFLYFQF
jgi:alginate O-acetyltransferase complex protein AlgI